MPVKSSHVSTRPASHSNARLFFFISVHFPEHCQEIAVENRSELNSEQLPISRASSALPHIIIYSLLCFEKNFFVNK